MNAFHLMLRLCIPVTLDWYLKTSTVLLIYKLLLLDNLTLQNQYTIISTVSPLLLIYLKNHNI